MVPFKFPTTLPYIIRLFGILNFYLYSEVVLQHQVNLYFMGYTSPVRFGVLQQAIL